MLETEKSDFLPPKVGPFCTWPKRLYLQGRDVGNCSEDLSVMADKGKLLCDWWLIKKIIH